jgi:antitoxin CptB
MSEPGQGALDPRRRKLLYRATHRGTKENDLLIGGFVSRRISLFSQAELESLEQLLDLPETDLADWVTGRRPVPPEADTPMLREIRDSLA